MQILLDFLSRYKCIFLLLIVALQWIYDVIYGVIYGVHIILRQFLDLSLIGIQNSFVGVS